MRKNDATRSGLGALMAALVLTLGSTAAPAAGAPLQTPLADKSKIAPLVEAIFEFDRATEAGGGRLPADARERMRAMQALAPAAKGELRALATRLKAAGEIEAFGALVEAQAGPAVAAELRRAGGAGAVLARAGSLLDAEIAARRRASETGVVELLERLLGFGVAHASFRRGVCAGFWWVISAGYGEEFAYTSCYKY